MYKSRAIFFGWFLGCKRLTRVNRVYSHATVLSISLQNQRHKHVLPLGSKKMAHHMPLHQAKNSWSRYCLPSHRKFFRHNTETIKHKISRFIHGCRNKNDLKITMIDMYMVTTEHGRTSYSMKLCMKLCKQLRLLYVSCIRPDISEIKDKGVRNSHVNYWSALDKPLHSLQSFNRVSWTSWGEK